MTQLILNGNLTLPEVRAGRYSCTEAPLTVQVSMASGRVVEELRGHVWQISYSWPGTVDNAALLDILAVLRGRGGFPVAFLPEGASAMETGTFICTSQPQPEYVTDRMGSPVWSGLSFSLREVNPHD